MLMEKPENSVSERAELQIMFMMKWEPRMSMPELQGRFVR